jgi:hypothetical protein
VIALTNRYQKKPKKVTYSKKSYIFKKKKKALAQTFRSHSHHPSYKILTKSPLFSRKVTGAEKRDDIFIIKPRKLKLWLEKKKINDIPCPQKKRRTGNLHRKPLDLFSQPSKKSHSSRNKNKLRSLLRARFKQIFSHSRTRISSPHRQIFIYRLPNLTYHKRRIRRNIPRPSRYHYFPGQTEILRLSFLKRLPNYETRKQEMPMPTQSVQD